MAEVVLYTRDWCSYSDAARALLERKGVAFKEINATGNRDCCDLANEGIQSIGVFTSIGVYQAAVWAF